MKSIMSLIIVLTCVGHPQTSLAKTSLSLTPFSTDGCSSFPNGYGSGQWLNCCELHDIEYWLGLGGAQGKETADHNFHVCLAKKGHEFLSWLMPFGVRLGEPINFTQVFKTPFRWGYGWNKIVGKTRTHENHYELVSSQLPSVLPGLQKYRQAQGYAPLTEEEIQSVENKIRWLLYRNF